MIKPIYKLFIILFLSIFFSINVFSFSGVALNPLIGLKTAYRANFATGTEGYFDNGNRAWKSVNGEKTVYVHDGPHVIAEYKEDGTLIKEYVYSGYIDEILQTNDTNGIHYYHQDGLNSVVKITNNVGSEVASYNYEAFGKIKDQTGNVDNQITYTGRWFEAETGDYFYRARYYDAESGKFISRDPIKFKSGDFNNYRYAINNPIIFNDPKGLYKQKWSVRCNTPGAYTTNYITVGRYPTYFGLKYRYQWCYQRYKCCKNLVYKGYRWQKVGKPYSCTSYIESWIWDYARL